MAEEGIKFVVNAHVGRNADVRAIRESADAIILAAGATKPRDLPIEGRCDAELSYPSPYPSKPSF